MKHLNLQFADLGMEPVNIDWDNIRRFMMNDPTLVRLARVIQHGWPEYAKELEDDVKVYFPHQVCVTYCQWNHLYAQ